MRRRTTTPRWPRPTTAPLSAPTSTTFMRRWRGSGWRRWATPSRPSQPQLDRIQPAAGAAPGGYFSRGQPASGQGAPAGQCRLERVHRAGDQGRPRFLLLERAGRGADLLFLWRDLSRHARPQAGFAQRGLRVHPVHSAGLLADPLSGAVVGHDRGRIGQEPPRSLPGGLAHPPGVGVRSRRRSPMPTPTA